MFKKLLSVTLFVLPLLAEASFSPVQERQEKARKVKDANYKTSHLLPRQQQEAYAKKSFFERRQDRARQNMEANFSDKQLQDKD